MKNFVDKKLLNFLNRHFWTHLLANLYMGIGNIFWIFYKNLINFLSKESFSKTEIVKFFKSISITAAIKKILKSFQNNQKILRI